MTGVPEVVLLRGQVLVENGELVASPGVGQFVARAKFGEELKPEAAVASSGRTSVAERMTVQRMDRVGVVVDDLAAATAFSSSWRNVSLRSTPRQFP